MRSPLSRSACSLAYIGWQGGRGLESHFNISTPFHAIMYALMGIGASLLVATTHNGHAVGAVGGHLPALGWNRLGGDLRAPHLLGVHAQQAIPFLGALIAPLAPRRSWTLLLTESAAYTLVTLLLFAQALAGRPVGPF